MRELEFADVALLRLSRPAGVAANVVAWGVIHGATGYAVHRLPLERLQDDGWLLRPRAFERDGRWYERVGVRRWKDHLPEAGALFAGGVSKRSLSAGDDATLERFVAETRRAEWGHWVALASGPVALLWNPAAAGAVMVGYGIAVNAPFIAVQRYNRLRAYRVLERRAVRSRRSTSAPPAVLRSRTRGSSIP
ncbi:MAG: hypothetical protein ABWZ76_04340 [Acidimicrobiales bacterium]